MKTVIALCAAVVLGAVVSGALATAGARTRATVQIDVVEANKTTRTIDIGRTGLSAGDVFVVSDDLVDPNTKDKLGHMHEVCTTIHGHHVSLECVGTAEFADGQVSVTGEFPPPDKAGTYTVTGGSGTYANEGGVMAIVPHTHGVLELDFVLTPTD